MQSGSELFSRFEHHAIEIAIAFQQRFSLANRVQDSGVITAAKIVADGAQAVRSQLASEKHGQRAGSHDGLFSGIAAEVSGSVSPQTGNNASDFA